MLGVLVAITVMAANVFYTIGEKRIYEATATLLIDPDPPRPLGKDVQTVVDVGNGSFWSNKEYFETQTKILAGRSIARETAHILNLQRDAGFIANVPAGMKPPPDVKPLDLEDAARLVSLRMTVEPIRDSRLVNVKMDDADPARARRVLAALVNIYLQRNIDHAVQSTDAASEWLNNQKDNSRMSLRNPN